MATLAQLRAAMVVAAKTVTAIGVVNAFEPHATRDEDFKTFFLDDTLGYVLGWSLMREVTAEERRALPATFRTAHLMVLRGYRGLADAGATGSGFEDLTEALRDRLRQEVAGRYGGLCVLVDPPQVRIAEPRQFGSVLVHYVEITQRCIQENESV